MSPDIEKLRKSRGRIKRRAHARTAELAKVNKSLQTEITRHKQAEKELGLILTITRSIHDAKSFHSALEIVLQEVCESTGWSFGEAWVPRSDGAALECSPAWYGKGEKLRTFRNLSVGMTFAPGVGLPGRVWQLKRPDWILNPPMMAEKIFQRAEMATGCGLKAALGVPILVDDQVLAVLVFFMPESFEESRRMVDLVSAVAVQLGSVFKQKRAEEELRKARSELEERVQARTSELAKANEALRAEVEERRRAMEAIRESEERFRAMADQAPVMIWMSGPDRLCTYFNKGWLGFTGRTMEQELGDGWTEGVHPDDQQRCLEIYFNAFDGRRDFKMEYRLRCFDGDYRCILNHGTPRFLSDGSFQGYIGSCIDITERKQAEDALHESQRTLTTLMSNLPGMVYRCRNDRDWTMEVVSDGCLDLTGYQPFEVIENRKIAFARLIHAEDREPVWNEVQIALQERRPFQLVYRIITATGEEKWVWEQGSGIFSSDGGLQALEGFITDITDRRRAREALQQERDFAESLIETAQVIILVLDNEGRIVRFNPYMEEISGYRLEEVRGKDWISTFLPKRDQDLIRQLFLKAIRDIKTCGNVNPIVTKDGREREIEWYDKTLKDADGNTTGLISIGQDITERKRAETWLRTLIEATQDAVVSIDRSGHIAVFNPGAERIFGYTKAEAVGRKIDILMTESDASQHERYIARYEETGERKAIGRIRTLTARRKNGEEFPIELSLTELKTDEEIRYAAFIRDISEKARLQERLMENERLAAIGATTAKLAHEIGNPLNGMYLTVQLLQQQLSRYDNTRDDRTVSTVTKLENEIIRLNRLLMEFRSLSQHEKYHFRPVSLVKILTDVLEMEKPRYTDQGIYVEQDLPEDLPPIVADGDRLKQAFLNLCKNASEAMLDGGTLTVKACHSGDGVMLEIADTGTGIPEGMDITRPFTSTKLQGSGIGLVVVRQIIAAHGGSLAYSSAVGQGTTCRVSLPLYPMSAAIE